ncbi:hypothetical protein TorRG33x02_315720 [Trema orientale]|uniref:Uncharacterized protein n=1 Tax=Trema orientale TaxID=63057 RepID=A0A2P5BMM0_TREOI|nr:hypothetical protein TorRG33x02_315720 [Trema orientale]
MDSHVLLNMVNNEKDTFVVIDQLRERSAPLKDVIPLLLNLRQSRFQFQHLVWAHFRGGIFP